MANYQSNMRYSRMGNMYPQQRQNYNNMIGRDTCACVSGSREEQKCENCRERENKVEQKCEKSCEQESKVEQRCGNCCERESRGEQRYERIHEEHCEDSLSEMPLAMAYVPWQKWKNIYETCKGFHRGTIFAELDKPFLGRGGCNR